MLYHEEIINDNNNGDSIKTTDHVQVLSDPHARMLQYCECPQYLRRNFFPMHSDLQLAGLLATTH
jgi:predicted SPOUT superfamily RNA methylase MTH1